MAYFLFFLSFVSALLFVSMLVILLIINVEINCLANHILVLLLGVVSFVDGWVEHWCTDVFRAWWI
jgi:hypothetical protein